MKDKYLLADSYNDEIRWFPTKEEVEDFLINIDPASECVGSLTVYEVSEVYEVEAALKLKKKGE